MNSFNESEFQVLCERFGTMAEIKEITISYDRKDFFNKMQHSVESDRRGEVVFCVQRKNGKIITVTCSEYPKGIFRIPTGGIAYGEDIVEALFREVREELGLKVDIVRFAGVIKIDFQFEEQHVPFYSYLFILKEIGGRLLEDAEDDEVSEVGEVGIQELEGLVEKLRNIPGSWGDWGKFRYETSGAILNYIKDHMTTN